MQVTAWLHVLLDLHALLMHTQRQSKDLLFEFPGHPSSFLYLDIPAMVLEVKHQIILIQVGVGKSILHCFLQSSYIEGIEK